MRADYALPTGNLALNGNTMLFVKDIMQNNTQHNYKYLCSSHPYLHFIIEDNGYHYKEADVTFVSSPPQMVYERETFLHPG